jgi:hypothetical protein
MSRLVEKLLQPADLSGKKFLWFRAEQVSRLNHCESSATLIRGAREYRYRFNEEKEEFHIRISELSGRFNPLDADRLPAGILYRGCRLDRRSDGFRSRPSVDACIAAGSG